MEIRYWGTVKTNSKSVTIAKDGQVFHFKSFKDCVKFLTNLEGGTPNTWQECLKRKVEEIAGWHIFYEKENIE